MLANLTLMYSKNAKVNLIENKELREIDEITSLFIDDDDLKNCDIFKEKVESFYRRYSNYSRKIANEEAKKGYLVINFINDELENMMSPIYNLNKDKLDIKYLANKIERILKEKQDKELILKIYNEEDFLKTDYNYAINNIGYCLRIINTYGVSKDTIKQYNKLVRIIKDTILIDYNAKKDEVPSVSYFHARKIYDTINKNSFIKPTNIRINKSNNTPLLEKNYRIEPNPPHKNKKTYHSIGDFYLDYLYEDREEKRWIKK